MKHLKILLFILLFLPLLAYRPFYSTDADVEKKKAVEVELGVLTIDSYNSETLFTSPSAVINIGLGKRIELVTEFKAVHTISNLSIKKSQFEDVNLFLKGLFAEGALQGKRGVSVAMEGGFLLPTLKGEKTGTELTGIVSGKLYGFTWHFNLGGFIEKDGQEPGYFIGLILETPEYMRLRLVGEITYERVIEENGKKSLLIGVIYEKGNLALDFAIRRGIAEDFFSLTAGITFSI